MAENRMHCQTDDDNETDYGVLLYYKYTEIPHLQSLCDFYHFNCTSLSLLGRVRLSSHGVNVTVGGRLGALRKHIEALKCNELFQGTDFKLASCFEPRNDQVAKECGFTSLSIRIVKELVTLTSHPLLKSPEISNAGRHLSATEFHSVLQNAGKCEAKTSVSNKKLVLLDARNLYETRIGKFDNPDVQTLDPEIRQYSDLPSWIDDNSEQLRGNNILMYCTGGIRCEMASAYLRSKGAGFENVFQLYGGIQRYMEQFPDGGFFKGKNFVFDHRVSVGSSNTSVLGACLLCGVTFDDYTSRCRCTHCRMLVLVCHGCQEKSSTYICELCQKNGKPVLSISSPGGVSENVLKPKSHDNLRIDQVIQGQCTAMARPTRKLRILCLHGFRQSASGFKGRTASLAKKLKNIVEFVFVDAPHELAFIYQYSPADQHDDSCKSALAQQPPPSANHCNRKFAWLVAADYDGKNNDEWKMAEAPFNSLQYQQQTEGFEKSIEYLKTMFSQLGPFDGILGFSQGAAMAALVSRHMERFKGKVDFRFVILSSGFPVAINPAEHHGDGLMINIPSLHIFGGKEGGDRQIDSQASRQLASFFQEECRVVIEHDFGHIIPTRSPYIDEIKNFLRQFL